MATADDLTLRVSDGILDIDARQWDACAGTDDPFVSHAFLSALEASGSVVRNTGWIPQHLLVEDAGGRLLACAPLYLKSHSFGEYVFDWGWADAFHRAGGRYYPKLQCAVPFTPVTGRRLLVAAGQPVGRLENLLIEGMLALARRHKVSSLHVTFPTEEQWQTLCGAGLLPRLGLQYHWNNRGYANFDDFLADLSSRKRKAIRKERQQVADQGIIIATLRGDAITPKHWDVFYRFYLDTIERKWANAYLNHDFFTRLGASMADRIVLVWATRGALPVAAALNLLGRDTLYGRLWGCHSDFKFLHFEACYYRAIDFAIAHGLARVEAGAQGEHKVQRGYLPQPTYSAHWIADERLRRAVAQYLVEERSAILEDIAALRAAGPFRREQADAVR